MGSGYANQNVEVLLTPDTVVTTSSGKVGKEWAPICVPHIISMFAVVLDVGAGVAGDIELRKESMETETATVLTKVTLTTADVDGAVVYKRKLDITINPGEKVYLSLPSGLGSGPQIKGSILVRPTWESLANVALTRETA